MIKSQLKKELEKILKTLTISSEKIEFEHPAEPGHGDYSSNIALLIFANLKNQLLGIKSPIELAEKIAAKWQEIGLPDFVQKIEVVSPGFLNLWLKIDYLGSQLSKVLEEKENYGLTDVFKAKKIMVEYAHPNTHKELHIGHMRTLIVGETLARIFSATGARVFRANYQGDIGPHVAKSIWGTEKILEERKINWDQAEKMTLAEKAHLLGEGYVLGTQKYEDPEVAKEIDELNSKLYQKDSSVVSVYDRTRRWCLEYYDTFYNRFYTKFDRLFFESEVFGPGKEIVEENVGKVFQKSQGAIIFDGEPYGLHKRVFVTQDGNATYEGKDMALAPLQYQAFPFDLNLHVVANEQIGYFQVIIKALELLDPKFKGKEFHLPMGMVQLVGKKMSSRTGVFLKVDDLLTEVKKLLLPLITKEGITKEEKEKIAEVLTIASVKYSILRVGPRQDVVFDPEKSVSLEGDSGPYLEYTYARTQSVLGKVQKSKKLPEGKNYQFNKEEIAILRTIYKFPEIVAEAAQQHAPNLICGFLYDLCQKYNLFYDKWRILGEPEEKFRLSLTTSVGQIIKNGLNLLGIESIKRM